jgi:pimeloyl-ACP methyl ester carboxylesterase
MPTIKVNGVRLNYVVAGSGPETIVFAHGLMMSSESYREQLRYFSDRYRVVAYDHRGHGRSSSPWSGYDMDTIAEDAAQLIEHLGAPVHFGGLSMGGFVGLRLAARRPQLLRSLVLMATSADEHAGSKKLARAVSTGLVRTAGFKPIARQAVRMMYGAPYLRDRDNYDAAIAYVNRLPKSLWRSMTAVIDRPSVARELSRISVPTLVVVGNNDTLLPPPNSLRLAAAIPNARLVRIPGTGHLITDENPEAANGAIDRFLDEIATGRAELAC